MSWTARTQVEAAWMYRPQPAQMLPALRLRIYVYVYASLTPFPTQMWLKTLGLVTQPLTAIQWLENEKTQEIWCSGETSGNFLGKLYMMHPLSYMCNIF